MASRGGDRWSWMAQGSGPAIYLPTKMDRSSHESLHHAVSWVVRPALLERSGFYEGRGRTGSSSTQSIGENPKSRMPLPGLLPFKALEPKTVALGSPSPLHTADLRSDPARLTGDDQRWPKAYGSAGGALPASRCPLLL